MPAAPAQALKEAHEWTASTPPRRQDSCGQPVTSLSHRGANDRPQSSSLATEHRCEDSAANGTKQEETRGSDTEEGQETEGQAEPWPGLTLKGESDPDGLSGPHATRLRGVASQPRPDAAAGPALKSGHRKHGPALPRTEAQTWLSQNPEPSKAAHPPGGASEEGLSGEGGPSCPLQGTRQVSEAILGPPDQRTCSSPPPPAP